MLKLAFFYCRQISVNMANVIPLVYATVILFFTGKFIYYLLTNNIKVENGNFNIYFLYQFIYLLILTI